MIYFDEYGNKENPTILMLHGAGLTHSFTCQYCFKDKYHLIVPHLFGSGKETDKVYEPEKQIEALVELIKYINKDKIIVMGHSLGGELSVALVCKYPEFFKKAVFLSPWLFSTKKSIKLYSNLGKRMHFTYKYKGLIRFQCRYWKFTKEQADFMVEYSKHITKEQMVAWYSRRISLNKLPEYEGVNIPMLAACGSRETKETKYSLQELKERNPRCKTILLKGAGHDYPMRKAREVNKIILDFLSS